MSLKIAVIAPISALSIVEPHSDCFMSLVHLMQSNKFYREFHCEKSETGELVMLDPSLYDADIEWDVEDFAVAAGKLNPTEVIAPDVIFDKKRSTARLNEFLEYRDLFKSRIMAVPQGKNLSELLQNYKELLNYTDVVAIGLPYLMADFERRLRPSDLSKRRVTFVTYLIEHELIDTEREYHLLGLGDVNELPQQNKLGVVRSCDTSMAFLFADKGLSLRNTTEKPTHKLDFSSIYSPDQIALALENVEVIREYAAAQNSFD